MNFSELKLLVACHAVQSSADPKSDAARLKFARRIQEKYIELFHEVYFPWTTSQVIETHTTWRKNKDTRIKAEIAIAHDTYHCFWRRREKGPCSEEVEGGHVVAASAGGLLTVPNGVIECRAHNNQRRARSIEDYLASKDTTS